MKNDQIDRAAIRARAEAATSGPWEIASPRPDGRNAVQKPGFDMHGKRVTEWIILDTQPQDAEFIAHAREDVPALLASLEVAEGKLAKIAALRRYTLDSFDQMSPLKPGAKNGLLYGEEIDTILETKEER